nr:MAG TPA: hypothetical protein [Caudoviricetes sp.]
MVQRYEVRGSEIGSGADWVAVVTYEDYVKLELKLRRLAKQVIDRPCNWKTYELAREILDL